MKESKQNKHINFLNFIQIFRQMTNKWTEIVEHNGFSLQKFISSEREQMQWQGEGLSSDQLSIQNAIIMLKVYV